MLMITVLVIQKVGLMFNKRPFQLLATVKFTRTNGNLVSLNDDVRKGLSTGRTF